MLTDQKCIMCRHHRFSSYKDLKKAMKKAYEKNFIGTDESMLIKELGIDINIVEGSMLNFKVTTATDIEIFEKLTRQNQ